MSKILPVWPRAQKFKFNKYKKKFIKSKLDYIENFFKKKYNSKYCIVISSARIGIILALKFKKFNRSKVFKIPKWSPHCLSNSIGYLTNITTTGKEFDGGLLVHHLGISHRTQKKKLFFIDDSSDSLPTLNFKACYSSSFLEVISLPKIIGSYAGGLILTNNYKFYLYVKSLQSKSQELSFIQSQKKYNCLILKKNNYDWQYSELENYGLDYNTCENIYENLINFEINFLTINKRKKLIDKYSLTKDKYRVGPCIIMKYEKTKNKIFQSLHINIKKLIDNEIYFQRHILPIHFDISDEELEEKLNVISKS